MKRSNVFTALVILFLAIAGTAGFAQNARLAVTANKVVVDGVVNANEYSFSQDFGEVKLYVNRTQDALSLAAVGATTGWVAVGLGSLKMDKSIIFIGFIGKDGKVQFKPQVGVGHLHRDPDKSVADTLTSYAMKEAEGKTTLELSLKPGAYIASGQAALDIIWAAGVDKSFIPRHSSRGSLSLKLN